MNALRPTPVLAIFIDPYRPAAARTMGKAYRQAMSAASPVIRTAFIAQSQSAPARGFSLDWRAADYRFMLDAPPERGATHRFIARPRPQRS